MHFNEHSIRRLQELLIEAELLQEEPSGHLTGPALKAYQAYAIQNGVPSALADHPSYIESVPGEIGDILRDEFASGTFDVIEAEEDEEREKGDDDEQKGDGEVGNDEEEELSAETETEPAVESSDEPVEETVAENAEETTEDVEETTDEGETTEDVDAITDHDGAAE
jgi:hypothetical protein